jgi:hypothetical protein
MVRRDEPKFMNLTSEDYSVLRVFLLKVINHSDPSITEDEVWAAKIALDKLKIDNLPL